MVLNLKRGGHVDSYYSKLKMFAFIGIAMVWLVQFWPDHSTFKVNIILQRASSKQVLTVASVIFRLLRLIIYHSAINRKGISTGAIISNIIYCPHIRLHSGLISCGYSA